MANQIDSTPQYYSVSVPSENELVRVVFTEQKDGFYTGQLREYNCSVIMKFSDVTKKRTANFNKFTPTTLFHLSMY